MPGILGQKKLKAFEIEVRLGPSIDEHTDLSPIDLSEVEVIHFDLSGLTHINSAGIRTWITWIEKNKLINPDLFYNFTKCPKIFIDQANMIDGFLPEKSKIYSVAVPYFCEKCEKEATVSYSTGHEMRFEGGRWQIHHPNFSCAEKQCEYEPDVAETYFSFLEIVQKD